MENLAPDPTPVEEIERWIDRFKRHFREVVTNTLIAGLGVFVISNALLFLSIRFFPEFFVNYLNPLFNSDGSRDILFYAHPFVLTHSLSLLWNRFQKYFSGHVLKTGLEFGILYTVVALVPILWLTYAAMEVDMTMVFSWLMYGLIQTSIAGVMFSFIRKKNWV